MTFGNVTPILRIFDLAKAREFYVDFLGFRVDWEHRFGENFPVYMQVSRGDCIMHLSEHHGDATPGSAVRVETTGLDRLHDELERQAYRYLKPSVEGTDWGSRILRVVDPFGNRITFSESGESPDAGAPTE